MNLVTVGSSSSDAGKNKCKGPEAEMRLMGVRNRKEASMAGQERARGT